MFQRLTNRHGDTSIVWTDGDSERTLTAVRYVVDAHPGEPLFCIRGRDRLAIPAAAFYLALVQKEQRIDYPVAAAVQTDIDALLAWQTRNPDLMKYPDR